jgi:esterase/lipase superfamily enzyme
MSRTAGRLTPAPKRRATTAVPRPWFHNRLNEFLETAVDRDLLVFVHGFNVNFDSAVLRAAQIANDMPFNGAIVCYAWPSQGGIRNYSRDEEVVQRTATPLASFLSNLAQSAGSRTRINILVHSMGNRAVLAALNQLPQTVQQRRPFRHVVFAAPDVSAARFHTQVAAVTNMAQQVTLYACSGDTALKASRQLHRDPNRPWIRIERAGDSTNPVVTPGVQTIDVSAVDTSFMGHSYYGSNKTVLTDLLYLLKRDRKPDQCPWLQPASIRSGTYWKMDKRQIAILPVRQKR